MRRTSHRFGVPFIFAAVLTLPIVVAAAPPLWAPLPLGPGFNEPPWGGDLRWPDKSTGSKDIIAKLTVAHIRIVLEQTSLESVQKHFGGVSGGEGDAGSSHDWLCLYQLEASTPWVIWLESDELDGGKVSGFQWRTIPAESTFDKRCQPLPRGSTVDLPVPITLGQTRDQFMVALGAPSTVRPDVLFYRHVRSGIFEGRQGASQNDVAIQLTHNIVEAISVWRASGL